MATPKEIVEAYYGSLDDHDKLRKLLHPQLSIQWNSQRGFLEMSGNELIGMLAQSQRSVKSMRFEITHIVAEGNNVAVRYLTYVDTGDGNEQLNSHSMAMWTVMDGKMYHCYAMNYQEEY